MHSMSRFFIANSWTRNFGIGQFCVDFHTFSLGDLFVYIPLISAKLFKNIHFLNFNPLKENNKSVNIHLYRFLTSIFYIPKAHYLIQIRLETTQITFSLNSEFLTTELLGVYRQFMYHILTTEVYFDFQSPNIFFPISYVLLKTAKCSFWLTDILVYRF